MRQCSANLGKVAKRISQSALDALQKYTWPGNVRELENAIEYAVNVVSLTENEISPLHLPQHIACKTGIVPRRAKTFQEGSTRSLAEYMAEYGSTPKTGARSIFLHFPTRSLFDFPATNHMIL